VRFFVLDVLGEAIPPGYDVIVSSLFLHHLADDEAVALLRRMGEAAERMVLINDLRRSRLGYLLAWVGTRVLSRSAVARVDGPLSVQAAYTVAEMKALAERAGLTGAQVMKRWPYRLLLRWDREGK
jgi:hypothetical protein